MASHTSGFSGFIRQHKTVILAGWEKEVRALPVTRDLERLVLLDHIPELLDRIADTIEAPSGSAPKAAAERHAVDRLDVGMDLAEVIVEYSILRNCVLGMWADTVRDVSGLEAARMFDQAIDKAIVTSVKRYTTVRDRTLQALDRIATAALESTDINALLQRLLSVVTEAIPAIDTAEILLVDGDVLRVRAAVGLDDALARGYTPRIGEGLAGAVAADGKPRSLQEASSDPMIKSPALRAAMVRAVSCVPLIDGGQPIGVACMGSRTAPEFSIQDQRLFEAMANRAAMAIFQHGLREAAEARAKEAQNAVQMREQILAIVSHDLRNPLGAIGLSAAMLLEAASEPRSRKQLEIIRRSADRMEHMIADLIDMASIQEGRLALVLEPASAEQLLAEAANLHTSLAEVRGISVTLENDLLQVQVRCDRDRILQVFANLVGNAIKFCRPGDVISLRGHRGDDRVYFVVADTGPGIADADLDHIFERYWSAEANRSEGSGLGLYISKGIVERHGGRLSVESKLGEGTTFTIALPVAN